MKTMILLSLLIKVLITFSGVGLVVVSAQQQQCIPKCTNPASPCWPSPEEWQKLNFTLSGRLLRPVPAASPCYKSTFNNQSCSEAMSNWDDPLWRAGQPGAVQYTNWEINGEQGCPLNTSASQGSCSRGNLPEYIVKAYQNRDIQLAVRFASLNNLRLVIRNSGHSYSGGSTSAGSLVVWTHFMRKNLTFHDRFTPAGCSPNDHGFSAVTTDAGTLWGDVYSEADARGLVVVGGMPGSLGTGGGYLQGGGHGPVSHVYGLAADNVLELGVVTADGDAVVANECQNTDLFWALRGGGGGTFGVVVSSVHRTYPAFDRVVGAFVSIVPRDAPSLLELTRTFIDLQPTLSRLNFGGYFELRTQRLFFGYLVPNGEVSEVNATLKGFLDYVHRQPGLSVQLADIKSFPSLLSWRSTASCIFFGPGSCYESTGKNLAVASRLIPEETMENNSMQLAQAMVNVLSNGISRIVGCFVAGGKVSEKKDNAVNPAWRDALWQLVLPVSWPEGTSSQGIVEKMKIVTQANGLLRDLTPNSGAYVNEADYNEPDWEKSLYGVHYEKLKAIKNQVDPKKVFSCHNCVGSEESC